MNKISMSKEALKTRYQTFLWLKAQPCLTPKEKKELDILTTQRLIDNRYAFLKHIGLKTK